MTANYQYLPKNYKLYKKLITWWFAQAPVSRQVALLLQRGRAMLCDRQ